MLPIDLNRIPSELLAGPTLAALAVPEVMGYTKISGTPVLTGLYTILIPWRCLPFWAHRVIVITLVKQVNPTLRRFCLEASGVDNIDVTSTETLAILYQQLKEEDVRLVVAQCMLNLRNTSHYTSKHLLGEDACFETLHEVSAAYDRRVE